MKCVEGKEGKEEEEGTVYSRTYICLDRVGVYLEDHKECEEHREEGHPHHHIRRVRLAVRDRAQHVSAR